VSGRNATVVIRNKLFENVMKLGITVTSADVVLV
jgi:hypothetical protein